LHELKGKSGEKAANKYANKEDVAINKEQQEAPANNPIASLPRTQKCLALFGHKWLAAFLPLSRRFRFLLDYHSPAEAILKKAEAINHVANSTIFYIFPERPSEPPRERKVLFIFIPLLVLSSPAFA
jgi:hypothetical protein